MPMELKIKAPKNVKIKLFSTLAFTIKGCVLGN